MVPRLTIILGCILLGYAFLLFRLYDVQLAHGGYYLARAASQGATGADHAGDRGAIYLTDKNGNAVPAATNKNFPLIYAVPNVIDDPQEAAHQLAYLWGAGAPDFLPQLSKASDTYEILQKKVASDIAQAVEDAKIKGVYVATVPGRFYSFGPAASHLLGFVGEDSSSTGGSGRYGVEKFYDPLLSGDAAAADSGTTNPDLTLTIEPNIQLQADAVLKKLITDHNGSGGSVIVAEPATGKILGLSSYPNFDPNNFGEAKVADFLNPITQKIYEPGSVVKVLTMASGLDAHKITPDTTFYDSGVLLVSGKKIQNWDHKAHGTVTMTNVIELSLNTGAAFAERQIGDQLFKDYLVRFGLGNKTGVDLPGELAGNLGRLTPPAPPIAFATASYGQGIAVTPLEILNAVAAIANGGKLMRPYVNAALGPKEIRAAVSPAAAEEVTKMMVSAVDKAKIAKIEGFSIAGKTGTAQVPDFVHGGYSNRVIDTYIGFGPALNPKFIILIKLDEPVGAPLAGDTVVPAFRNLAQFILNYYNIAPDRLNPGT